MLCVQPNTLFKINKLKNIYIYISLRDHYYRWIHTVTSCLFCCSLSHVRLFATPWTVACQASLSFTTSWSLLKLMSIALMMPSNHLILCRLFLLLPSNFPSIGVFSSCFLLSKGCQRILIPVYLNLFNQSPAAQYLRYFVSFRISKKTTLNKLLLLWSNILQG